MSQGSVQDHQDGAAQAAQGTDAPGGDRSGVLEATEAEVRVLLLRADLLRAIAGVWATLRPMFALSSHPQAPAPVRNSLDTRAGEFQEVVSAVRTWPGVAQEVQDPSAELWAVLSEVKVLHLALLASGMPAEVLVCLPGFEQLDAVQEEVDRLVQGLGAATRRSRGEVAR